MLCSAAYMPRKQTNCHLSRSRFGFLLARIRASLPRRRAIPAEEWLALRLNILSTMAMHASLSSRQHERRCMLSLCHEVLHLRNLPVTCAGGRNKLGGWFDKMKTLRHGSNEFFHSNRFESRLILSPRYPATRGLRQYVLADFVHRSSLGTRGDVKRGLFLAQPARQQFRAVTG